MNKKILLYSLYFKCRESYVILKDFISFLKKENIVDKYIFNLKFRRTNEDHLRNLFDINELRWNNIYFKTHLTIHKRKGGAFLISGAFHWDDTREGFSFWRNMHDKWYNMFNEKYSK